MRKENHNGPFSHTAIQHPTPTAKFSHIITEAENPDGINTKIQFNSIQFNVCLTYPSPVTLPAIERSQTSDQINNPPKTHTIS